MQNLNQASFHRNNRLKLRAYLLKVQPEVDLIVITGHSLMQASADQPFPFAQDSSFWYLTGLNEPGLVLVMDSKQDYLIAPMRDEVRQAFDGAIDHSELSHVSGIKNIYEEAKGWERLTKHLKKTKKIGTLMPIDSYLERLDMFANPSRQRLVERLHRPHHKVELIDVRPGLAKMRMIKQTYEITMIERAIGHTTELFEIIEDNRDKVVGEQDLLAEITRHSIQQGLEFAYRPIIASGANAVTLHYEKNSALIDKESLLLLDIGLKYNGYCADITRTVRSRPTRRQRQVYESVLAVQEFATSLLKPGTSLKEYEKQVQQFMGEQLRKLGLIKEISAESIRKYYPHSTSHFLGIDTHDAGDYEQPLEAGVVLTVEPGIYIPEEGIGIRIEDDILITEDGNRILTNKLPKNLTSLTIR